MARVLLIGQDWKERALLRAQLREEGIEAEGYLTPADAGRAFGQLTEQPDLIIVDLASSENPLEEQALLKKWAAVIPIWMIASRTIRGDRSFEGVEFEKILLRPISIGDLIEAIKAQIG